MCYIVRDEKYRDSQSFVAAVAATWSQSVLQTSAFAVRHLLRKSVRKKMKRENINFGPNL